MRRRILVTLVLVLGLSAVSFEMAYEVFLFLGNRNIVDHALADISAFYGEPRIALSSLIWYVVSGGLAWLGLSITRQLDSSWKSWVLTTAVLAFLLAPGFYVDPDVAYDVATLLSPADSGIRSLFLPAWLCILRYLVTPSYWAYVPIAILITFWPMPLLWLILLILTAFPIIRRRGSST